MATATPSFDLAGVLTLREIRSFLRRTHMIPLCAFIAVVYALASMLAGGMLALFPLHGGTTVEVVTGPGVGQDWWNYPGLLVVAPWGVLSLPFFPTLAMLVVSVGVGLGMAVAGALLVRLLRPSPAEVARSKAVGAVTGLTPAMISLVTLGSCCTTTAAASGGIGLIAQASGTSTTNLIVNNWYLGVAQIAIVWVALFGQDLLLTVYGGLLGLSSGRGARPQVAAPPFDRRWAWGATLRGLLAIGGLLWSLSMLAEWTTHPPAAAGAGWWVRWVVQHQLVAGVAVGAAFFPGPLARAFSGLRTGIVRIVRIALGVAAASLLVWLPARLISWGLDGLPGQVLGVLGAPLSWGAIPPGPVTGVALVVRWGLEFVAPAGFVLAAVLAPERAFGPLLATTLRPVADRDDLRSSAAAPGTVGPTRPVPSPTGGLGGSSPAPEPP